MSNENQAAAVEVLRNLVSAVASRCDLADIGDAYYAGVQLLNEIDRERAIAREARPVMFVVDAFKDWLKVEHARVYTTFFADEEFMTRLEQIVSACDKLGLTEVRSDRETEWGPQEVVSKLHLTGGELVAKATGAFRFVEKHDAIDYSGRMDSLELSLSDIRERLKLANPGETIFISASNVDALRTAYEKDNPSMKL